MSQPRNMGGLRERLFGVLDQLIAGKVDAEAAKAAASLAQTLINSVKVQVDFERLKLESTVPSILPQMRLIAGVSGDEK